MAYFHMHHFSDRLYEDNCTHLVQICGTAIAFIFNRFDIFFYRNITFGLLTYVIYVSSKKML